MTDIPLTTCDSLSNSPAIEIKGYVEPNNMNQLIQLFLANHLAKFISKSSSIIKAQASIVTGSEGSKFPFDTDTFKDMNSTELMFMFISILEYMHTLASKYIAYSEPDIYKLMQQAYSALQYITTLPNFQDNIDAINVFKEIQKCCTSNFLFPMQQVQEFLNLWTGNGKGGGIFDKDILVWLQNMDFSQFDIEDWKSKQGITLCFAMMNIYISLASDKEADHGIAADMINTYFKDMFPGDKNNLFVQGLAIYFYQLDDGNWSQAFTDMKSYFNCLPNPRTDDKGNPLIPAWTQTYNDIKSFIDSDPKTAPDYCTNPGWYLTLKEMFQTGEGG